MYLRDASYLAEVDLPLMFQGEPVEKRPKCFGKAPESPLSGPASVGHVEHTFETFRTLAESKPGTRLIVPITTNTGLGVVNSRVLSAIYEDSSLVQASPANSAAE